MCWLADNVFDWGGDFESCKKWNDSMLWRPLLRKTKWWQMSGEMIALTDVWGNHNKSRRFIASPRLIEPERAPIRERRAWSTARHKVSPKWSINCWIRMREASISHFGSFTSLQRGATQDKGKKKAKDGGSWLPNLSDLLIWFCICIWQQTKAIVG